MSYTRTFGQLTGSVRTQGDYTTSSDPVNDYISSDFIVDRTNAGYREAYEILAKADPDRLTTTSQYVTAVTTGSIPLPTDMYELRGIDVLYGNTAGPGLGAQWIRIHRDDPSPQNSPWELPFGIAYSGFYGIPARYRMEGQFLFVAPDVPANTTFRFTYVPVPLQLTGSDQPIDCTAGVDELTINLAIRECRIREDRDTGPIDVKIGLQTKRIRDMARDRDAGQAKRLVDPLTAGRGRGRRGGGFR